MILTYIREIGRKWVFYDKEGEGGVGVFLTTTKLQVCYSSHAFLSPFSRKPHPHLMYSGAFHLIFRYLILYVNSWTISLGNPPEISKRKCGSSTCRHCLGRLCTAPFYDLRQIPDRDSISKHKPGKRACAERSGCKAATAGLSVERYGVMRSKIFQLSVF